jgi:hypothetical protein
MLTLKTPIRFALTYTVLILAVSLALLFRIPKVCQEKFTYRYKQNVDKKLGAT